MRLSESFAACCDCLFAQGIQMNRMEYMKKRISVLFVGNNIEALRVLLQIGDVDLVGIVVESNRVSSIMLTMALVKDICVKRVKSKADLATTFRSFGEYDYIFMASFGWILEKGHIAIPLRGVLNLHYAYLPYYRGRHPIARAIQNNAEFTGLTVHEVDSGIDTGAIVAQRKVIVDPLDTDRTLGDKLNKVVPSVIEDAMECLLSDYVPTQSTEKGSYYPPINPEVDCHVDWHKPPLDIYNLIRSETRYNGAFSFVNDSRIRFAGARVVTSEPCQDGVVRAGTIIKIISRIKLVVAVNNEYSIEVDCAEEFPSGDRNLEGKVFS